MSSFGYYGKLDFKKVDTPVKDPDSNYDFQDPTVYMIGKAEEYYPQTCYTWDEESIFIQRGKRVLKYTRNSFLNLEAVDEKGNILTIPGTNAPYEGSDLDDEHKKIHYTGKQTPTTEFVVEEFNLETMKKKIYRVSEYKEEGFKMRELSCRNENEVIKCELFKYDSTVVPNSQHAVGFSSSEVDINDSAAVRQHLDKWIEENKKKLALVKVKDAVASYFFDHVVIIFKYKADTPDEDLPF